ncbi:hypothetical protein HRJ35_14985 [Shewanella oneidensis MR-1]|uniref:Mu phage uncharacterized protein n=1 Tax=Shewanella oneidensis (strain ATCC 700550 / JCM 31522 / CIP 106686 / LMG 19005 / NCIMB 14063 / MR-1) TaxID=211586 RepID=Q8EDR0_SHEON|nr:phage protein [Shewanella oneidensis]AAN55711.2 Mu phage uncharacterized protein [Shewanella oneidensis MR-1]MDX5995647.1 hypothetical protein [Shewanella oneidensis]MEE2026302.1 hypothetical protein [Shewanella oneidensis]QKG97186.1 hypothetical protein HRJ35_14985 [Shewanella oneidensis MR-1]
MLINNENKTEQLAALVAQAGGARKAEQLIESVRGAAPSKSAIDRAIKGGGTEYNIKCMIDDLTIALSNLQNESGL